MFEVSYQPGSYQELLKEVDEDAIYFFIFQQLIGIEVPRIEEMISSPWRTDSKASFRLYMAKNKLSWIDFGEPNPLGHDAIGLYRHVTQRSFREALSDLHMIHVQGKLHTVPANFKESKVEANIAQYVVCSKNLGVHQEYWDNLGVSAQQCKRFNIWLGKEVIIENQPFAKTTPKNPVFVYMFNLEEQSWQVYQPKKKAKKFRSRNIGHVLMGYEQLPTIGPDLIITGSYKCVNVLTALGYNAVSTYNETGAAKKFEAWMPELSERFENIYVMMDNDTAGVGAQVLMTQAHSNVKPISIPKQTKGPKDPTEVYQQWGKEALLELLP